MPRLRYWLVMYLVMTAAVGSGMYIGGRLLFSHEMKTVQSMMLGSPDQQANK